MKSVKSVKPVAPVKAVKPVAPEVPTTPESAMRILKTATCPSLSGKSKLTYQIGCVGKSDIQVHISANSGHGMFSDDWVALSDIQEVLDKAPSGEPITSFVLNALFRGKSANTPGFLFAALKQEGLVERSKDKQRCYERGDLKGFMASVKALNELTGDAKAKPQKAEAKPQKAAAKSKSAATVKKTASKSSAKKKA
jgi:hypothetical protein